LNSFKDSPGLEREPGLEEEEEGEEELELKLEEDCRGGETLVGEDRGVVEAGFLNGDRR